MNKLSSKGSRWEWDERILYVWNTSNTYNLLDTHYLYNRTVYSSTVNDEMILLYIYICDIINNLKYKQLNSVNAWIQIFQIKKKPQ